ncbi:MAG: hypothetical protein M1836_006373 [Candelina mexicana]|nr:MAG: hypothetical protein M1836_006373 [Candelina mexicana]
MEYTEYSEVWKHEKGFFIVGVDTVRLHAILPDGSVKALNLTEWNPECGLLWKSASKAIVAYAPLINSRFQLQLAVINSPPSAKDHFKIVATTSKDCSTTAAISSLTAEEPTPKDRFTIAAVTTLPEARCNSAATESSTEDRSAIAAFNDFKTSLLEAHNDQDTSSEEGLLDEEDHDSTSNEHGLPCGGVLSDSSSAVCSTDHYDEDVEKLSSLEATEALALPGTIYKQDRCADHCDDEKPSLLETMEVLNLSDTASQFAVTEDLALPGTMVHEKPSQLEAAEALALSGTTIYEQDRYADHCPTTIVATYFTPSNRKSTTVAFIQRLAATCTSYDLFDPGGGPSYLPLPLLFAILRQPHLPCLFDWHLQKPTSRLRPLQLLGSEDINEHWVDKKGVGQATADGGGMGKELGIPAVAVLYSTATAGPTEALMAWSSYGYSTPSMVLYDGLKQCTPYGGATPRKPSLFRGTQSDSTPYGGATQQKTSAGGTRKSTMHVAVTRQLFASGNSLSFDPEGVRSLSPPQSISLMTPFNPGGLSSIRSWLIDLFYVSSFFFCRRFDPGGLRAQGYQSGYP